MSSYLNFETSTILTLKHNGDILDKVGQDGIPTADSFDFAQFLYNPYDYLDTLHLDLNDFQNIDLRRGRLITGGDTAFASATDLIENWGAFDDGDLSDLGQHYCLCNRNPLQGDIFGFSSPSFRLNTNYPSGIDPVTLTLNGVPNDPPANRVNYLKYTQQAGSTAYLCTDVNWTGPTPSASTTFTCTSADFNYTPYQNPRIKPLVGATCASGAHCDIKLTAASSGITIDNLHTSHSTLVYRELAVHNSRASVSVAVVPNYTAGDISVVGKGSYEYVIRDMYGHNVANGKVDECPQKLSTAFLSSGMYVISFRSPDNEVIVRKFNKL